MLEAFWNVLNVLLWERFGSSGLEKVFETVYEKNRITHMFFVKAISRAFCCYFLVDTALQITLIMYQLPETTGRIDEKVTEETTDQNFSNMKLLTTDAPHTPMTPSFVWRLGRFLCI